ncbi:MAG TPA: HPP family protein [Frankiaceae bacterium]|nr:HPP family protein [Frankiaceae bacterium]
MIVPFGPDAPVRPPVSSGIRAFPSAATLFVGALALMAVAGAVALGAKQTLLFPSLGPTAMLFFARPLPPECTVRNVIVGHWVGILTGLVALEAFGLRALPSAVTHGLDTRRAIAAALSVAVTATILRLIRSPHAPAGASTLIVSLGLLTTNKQLLMMAASVALVAVAGWALNGLTGVRVPIWRKPGSRPPSDVGEVIPPPWYPVPDVPAGPSGVTQVMRRPPTPPPS